MRAPWGFAVRAHGQLAFHVLLSGKARLDADGLEAPIDLEAGDVVLLPRGPEHRVRSAAGAPIEWLDDILAEKPIRFGQLRYGGRGAETDLVCGLMGLEGPSAGRIANSIPAAVVVRAADGAARWLQPLLELLRLEIGAFEPGADSMASRLADVLLLQVLRSAIGDAAPVVIDRHVGKAIRLMRDDPARAWTVDELARAVACSRSALAQKFVRATGFPPMRYLSRLRTALISGYLAQSDASLAEIAHRVGYGSEAALSKAFLREVGVSPGVYRDDSRAQTKQLPGAPRRRRTAATRTRRSTAA
jgi:AraC-like DNA-binding protein